MSARTPAISFDQFTTFGDLLKFLRRRAGLTQRELSIAVGYSDAQISRLEQNQRLPDLATITARFVPALDAEDEPAAVKRLMELAAAVRREDAPLPGLPPFKGLHYFDEADAELFFGREALTANLVARLTPQPPLLTRTSASGEGVPKAGVRFLAIIGASGSGKSSLVRAGVASALRWNPHSASWPVHTLTPTAHPLESLVQALDRDSSFASNALRDPRCLHLALKQETQRVGALHVMLVVDQFEELFALCREELERKAFIDNLLTAAFVPEGPAVVTLTLRADFYAHCAPYDNLREALTQHQEYIGPMTSDELRRAIEEPAKQGGWELEPGLVDLLLNDVGEEPGALPLLSHALLETWQRRQGRRLTLSGYTSSGGVRGAIAETAETVFKDQLSAEQREIARRIFLRLTELGEDATVSDTRRRAGYDELIHKPEDAVAVREVLKALADARLIITEKNSAEVAHEALIREWPTLRGWLEENREGLRLQRRLTEAAQTWNEFGRQPGELYRDARLAQAMEWAATHEAEMNALEREFLDASKAHAEHEAAEREAQRQRELEAARRLAETERARAESEQHRAEEQVQYVARVRTRNRVIAAAGAVALVLAVLAGLFGWQSNQSATRAEQNLSAAQIANTHSAANAATAQFNEQSRATQQAIAEAESQRAEQEKRLATSRELALAANSNLSVDPERSILLALQALSVARTVEAESALHNAVQASRVQLTLNFDEGVWSVAYSPDGTRLATISGEDTVQIWDADTGKELFSFSTPPLGQIRFSPNGTHLAISHSDNTVRIWDATTGKEVLKFSGHTDWIQYFAFSRDGMRLATGSGDKTAKIWDAATGQELLTLSGHTDTVGALSFNPDGTRLVTGSWDTTAKVWDLATGKEVLTLAGHALPPDVLYSPDGTRIVTHSADVPAKVWDAATGQELFALSGPLLYGIATFSPDGTRLIKAHQDGTVIVWDLSTGQELLTYPAHLSIINDIAMHPDGIHIATVSSDGAVKVSDISPEGNREWLTLTGLTGRVPRVVYSPDGTRLSTSGPNNTAIIWDAETGKLLVTLTGHTDTVLGLAFSPDGLRVATSSRDNTAKVWDAISGRELFTLSKAGHGDGLINATHRGITAVAFSPDGKWLATAGSDGTAILWDAETGQALLTVSNPQGFLYLAFSPDGTRLVTGGGPDAEGNSAYRVWDIQTGQELFTMGTPNMAPGVAFSPDGTRIVTGGFGGGFGGFVKMWDAVTGQELFRLPGHTSWVPSVAFSPDGLMVASASLDGTAKLWDASTGKELLTLYGHTGGVSGVAFSPDGTRLVTASNDGTARVYLLRLEDLVALAKSRVTRTLTTKECQQYLHVEACP